MDITEPAALAAIDKVTKLLALANNNPNEAEAQSALDMAHRILEQHNLDVAHLGQHSKAKINTRQDDKKGGGSYKWQRQVWEQTAKLNMCVYQSIRAEAKAKAARRLVDPRFDLECKAEEAAQAREDAKWSKRYSRRSYSARETAEDRRRNTSEYYQGREAGRTVSLDQQVADKSAPKLK